MINLCLDTNVYLSFYHYGETDLSKLEDMIKLIEGEELNIILPQQIENEYFRNRENVVKETIKKINEMKISFKLPILTDSYSEKEDIKKISKQYSAIKNKLSDKIKNDAENFSLKADELISKIFELSERIKMSDDIWNKAKKRFDLGNPPGKDKSYGDSVVWETLLKYDKRENIDFISIDRDFSCSLNPNNLSIFLYNEWDKIKEGKIIFFNSLNSFFQKYFSNIEINYEFLKNKCIENLEISYSFDFTRSNLIKLSRYEGFSLDQINRLVDASISNNQIFWAKDYTDWISQALINLIKPYYEKLDFSKLMNFLEIYDYEQYCEYRTSYEAQFLPKESEEPDFDINF